MLYMVSWAYMSQPAKQHFDQFSYFCTDKQTDTHTTLWPHRMHCVHATRPTNEPLHKYWDSPIDFPAETGRHMTLMHYLLSLKLLFLCILAI